MQNRIQSLIAVILGVPVFLGLTLGWATSLFSQSATPSAAPSPSATGSGTVAVIASPSASPFASPSVAASPVASWAGLPPVPEKPPPTEAEKKGQEISIYYTTNILGEVDPCG